MFNWITTKVKKYYENYVEDSNYYSWCKDITDRLTKLSDLLSVESHSDRPATINEEINRAIDEINILLLDCPNVILHKIKIYSQSTRSTIIKNVPLILLNAVNFVTGHLSTTKCTEKQSHLLHILIVSSISRPEFDLDPNEKEDILYKSMYLDFYKQTLDNLYLYVKRKLENIKYKSYNKDVTYYSPYIGFAKILAILNFRLAFFADLMRETLKFDDPALELSKIYNYNQLYLSRRAFKRRYLRESKVKKQNINENDLSDLFDSSRIGNLIEIDKNINNPILHNASTKDWWPVQFHYWKWINLFIPTVNNDTNSSADIKWLRIFGKGDSVFCILYIKEVLHFALSRQKNEISSFENYEVLELVYLSLFRRTFPNDLSNLMMETSKLFLHFNKNLIDFYIKWTFKKTNVLNIANTIDTLNKISKWFLEFKLMKQSLPSSFDHTFFCEGIDIIVNMDHLILNHHLLSLLYEFNDIFEGKARKVIFQKYLISKYFDLFFLHWDKTIRSYYHMVIIHTIKRNLRVEKGRDIKNISHIDTKIYSEMDKCIKKLEGILSTNANVSNQHAVYGHISLQEYNTHLINYNPYTVPETLKNLEKNMF